MYSTALTSFFVYCVDYIWPPWLIPTHRISNTLLTSRYTTVTHILFLKLKSDKFDATSNQNRRYKCRCDAQSKSKLHKFGATSNQNRRYKASVVDYGLSSTQQTQNSETCDQTVTFIFVIT